MAFISFQPKDNFNTKTYSGNSSTQNITGIGFQPDMVWTKKRDGTDDHNIFDVVRGVTKEVRPNKTDSEDTATNGLTAFGSDGYTIGDWGLMNQGHTYVSWNWKAANSQGSSNTDGSINTTYTSANTTSGFSISTYTGTGSNASIGHGLGTIPHWLMFKRLNAGGFDWFCYHRSLGSGKFILLDTDGGEQSSSSIWQNTTPTSSVITLGGDGGVNASGGTYVCYAFAEKQGFNRFGTYTGNGSTNGTFIYTGFKPSWVLIKSKGSGTHWRLADNKRDTFNPSTKQLFTNNNAAEATDSNYAIDFLSNGFKHKNTNSDLNQSSVNYIYIAFAEEPLVSSNKIPTTAR